jgi:hypothetical protein
MKKQKVLKEKSIQSDINYAELSLRNCHAGLSGILLRERFPTSGNDNYAAIVMTLCLIMLSGTRIQKTMDDEQ